MMELKLTVEIVPKTSWYNNVRSQVSRNMWDKLRKECYARASHKCEICGSSIAIECHEIWEYDDINHIQKLIGLISLCNKCHTVKHPGLAKINGKEHIVMEQLMAINNMTERQVQNYLSDAFEIWAERSKYQWKIDTTYLNNYLIK